MKRSISTIILIFFIIQFSSAQYVIMGKVFDAETNLPISGVSVLIKNSSSGTITDSDGNFVIESQEEIDQLYISHLGYKSTTIKVSGDRLEVALTPETTELDEVVISATKTEHSVYSVPASISIVGKNKIDNSPVMFTDEALRSVPGLYIKRSKMADQTTSVTLRGFSGDSRTLVLIDGFPLNDGYNQNVNWNTIPVDAIEKIEVIKGSFSSLYGGNAMGGVINIMTTIPKEEKVTVKAGYGTYNTINSSVSYTNRFFKDKIGVFVNLGQQSTDGYASNFYQVSAKDGADGSTVTGWKKTKNKTGSDSYLVGDVGENYMKQIQLSSKLVWYINPSTTFDFTYNFLEHNYGYRNSQSYLTDSAGLPVNSGTYTIDDNGIMKNITLKSTNFLNGPGNLHVNLCKLHYKTTINSIVLNTHIGYTDDSKWYSSPSSEAIEGSGPGKINITKPKRTYTGNIQADIPVLSHMLTIGADYRMYYAKGEDRNLLNWKDEESKTTLNTSMEGKQQIIAPFAQAEIKIIDGLRGFLGIRYDYWRNENGKSYDVSTDSSIIYDNTVSSQFSPKAGIVYMPEWDLDFWKINSIRASVGKSFRTPTLYNLYKTWKYYSTTYVSNPDLKPESSLSWEAGISQSFFNEHTRINFDYYQSYITNLMYSTEIEQHVKKYMNAGEGEIKGFEAEVKQDVLSVLNLNFNITKQKTRITENPLKTSIVGKSFTKVPDLVYNIGANFHKGPLNAILTYHFTDKVYASDENNDMQTGVYCSYDEVKLFDGKVSYNLNKNINLSLSVNNILNREYFLYYKAPGRTFTINLTAKF